MRSMSKALVHVLVFPFVLHAVHAKTRLGRGIAPIMQINGTHMRALGLGPGLTANSSVCIPGTAEAVRMQEWIAATKPSAVIPCCDDRGLVLPLIPYEYLWDNNLRAFLYIVSLLWCFVGVSVLADAFMAGIEAITSWQHKKRVPRRHLDGSPVTDSDGSPIVDTVEIPVWNEKVACLTLYALGSSAPEILIACMGCAPDFFEDSLGPGTVVGSATFNLYVITAICMVGLEAREMRKIEGMTVHVIQVCNNLQHTATLRNSMQQTAIRCTTLHHTALRCNTMRHAVHVIPIFLDVNTSTHCNTLQHTATHCNTLQHTIRQCRLFSPAFPSRAYRMQHAATHCNSLHLTATHMATHCKTQAAFSLWAYIWLAICLEDDVVSSAVCCSVLQCVAASVGAHMDR